MTGGHLTKGHVMGHRARMKLQADSPALLTLLRLGQCRYYVEQLALQGYVGVMMSQSPEYVAPHRSSQAVFGTNPIAIACPQAQGHAPLVVDFATSATTLYDLVAAREAGQEVRKAWACRPIQHADMRTCTNRGSVALMPHVSTCVRHAFRPMHHVSDVICSTEPQQASPCCMLGCP